MIVCRVACLPAYCTLMTASTVSDVFTFRSSFEYSFSSDRCSVNHLFIVHSVVCTVATSSLR